MKNFKKSNKGITLIALVITIIILLILASITIATLTGENGILNKSQTAKEENNEKTATEIMNLKITNAQIQSYAEKQEMPSLQYLANMLCEDEEMQYVELETQKQARLKEITVGLATSIFTKLKDYPYEFEIDANLRLASIDGIKVSDSETPPPSFGISEDDIRRIVREELDQKIGEIQVYGIYETIFEGSAKQNNKTYTLSKSINDYRYLIVYAKMNNSEGEIASCCIDKSCYKIGTSYSQFIGAHAADDWCYSCHYYFSTDKNLTINDIGSVGWEGTPEIFLIKGVK
jgi:uncharacterized protein YxeA